jgi:dihydropteroate synthase
MPLAVSTAPAVMGIVNVTPDSFSDGGRFVRAGSIDHRGAIEHGLSLLSEGATVLDVGGESTRPGFTAVHPAEELERVLPVVEELSHHAPVSIDTRHPEVARAALAAGATMLNDVSATLWPLAAEHGAAWVACHAPSVPGSAASPVDPALAAASVVEHVRAFLADVAARAVAAGVDEVWVDPGIGFGTTPEQGLALVAALDRLVADGVPVVVGVSRKSTVGRLLAASDRSVRAPALPGLDRRLSGWERAEPVAVDDRSDGSLAFATWAAIAGVAMVRAHDVQTTVQAMQIASGDVPARGGGTA